MEGGGKVYLVGAGPGDPGLLTLRGREILQRADVILYDALANPVLLDFAPAGAVKIHVGKRAGQHLMPQSEIQAILGRYAREGKSVVRLKGGDPVLFGRGAEEAEFLADQEIPFEIVPGVPSAFAVPIYSGIPVTHRELASSVTIVTGHSRPGPDGGDPIDWAGLARSICKRGTLVVLMGLKSLPAIVARLLQEGAPADTPAATVVSGTYAHQRRVIGTLESLPQLVAEAELQPPALTIFGHVVQSWGRLDWFQSKPLFGRRIVVTRPKDQAASLAAPLSELGAEVIELPVIAIRPLPDTEPLRAAMEHIAQYRWILFTSPNGVRHFLRTFLDRWGDIRRLQGPRLAAIGPGTAAELAAYHLPCDLQPETTYQQEGLLEALTRESDASGSILIPRAREARTVLPDGLRELGWTVDVVAVYETVGTPLEEIEGAIQAIQRNGADWVTLTSSSTAERFVQLLQSNKGLMQVLGGVRYASIGPITTKTAEGFGLPIAVEAKSSTIEGLVEALVKES